MNTGFYIARSNARTCRLFREAATGSEGERSQQGVVAPLLLQHYFLHGLRISVLGPRCPPKFAEIRISVLGPSYCPPIFAEIWPADSGA